MTRLATSDEFTQMMERNLGPFRRLMTYYECAMMEVETKFRVLDAEYSLQHDRNPIELSLIHISYDRLRHQRVPSNQKW